MPQLIHQKFAGAGLGPGKGAEICHERRQHEYGLVDLLPLGSSWTALKPPAT
jgi:hypothetical protein